MNVLSLFDGMSCGQIALNRIGVKPTKYYASEIDKHAIQVTQANYPNTIQMGSVTDWREWNVDWSTIDLFIGGSPCQGFSAAGKQAGTAAMLNGEKVIVDTRERYLELKIAGAEFMSQSYLFWEYILLLDHVKACNPKVKYFLENVKMKKEFLDLITNAIGVEPVFINSALVSAQNRQRWYWCNWGVTQPEDKGILLKDIIEHSSDEIYKTKTPVNHDGGSQLNPAYKSQANAIHDLNKKMPTICAGTHGYALGHLPIRPCEPKTLTVELNERVKGFTENERGIRFHKGDKAKSGISELGRILKPSASKTDSLTTSHMPKVLTGIKISSAKDKNPTITGDFLKWDPNNLGHDSDTQRVNLPNSKHKCLVSSSGGNKHGVVTSAFDFEYRKLTPRECGRLQTIPEHILDTILSCGVSNTQLYKMFGNGWTIDVIAHIFSQMDSQVKPITGQTELQF